MPPDATYDRSKAKPNSVDHEFELDVDVRTLSFGVQFFHPDEPDKPIGLTPHSKFPPSGVPFELRNDYHGVIYKGVMKPKR